MKKLLLLSLIATSAAFIYAESTIEDDIAAVVAEAQDVADAKAKLAAAEKELAKQQAELDAALVVLEKDLGTNASEELPQ